MNTPTRRQFLRDCSVAAAVATLLPAAVVAGAGRRASGLARPLTLEWFAGELHSRFGVRSPGGRLGLCLVAAERLAPTHPGAPDARNERFRLVFQGPAQHPLTQDTYLFEHPRLGHQAIFIVPRPTPAPGADCYYEAVFNCPSSPGDLAAQLALAPCLDPKS